MKTIKKYDEFLNESVDRNGKEVETQDDTLKKIVEILEDKGYNIIDTFISNSMGKYIYFVIEDEHPFSISYTDHDKTLSIIVELREGGTDTLGCFNIDENIVDTIVDVISSYCEQTIENNYENN